MHLQHFQTVKQLRVRIANILTFISYPQAFIIVYSKKFHFPDHPFNTTIHQNENKTVYTIGDQLKCTSKGEPTPEITWEVTTDSNVTLTMTGETLNVTEKMIGNCTVRCLATNALGTDLKEVQLTVIGQNMSFCF